MSGQMTRRRALLTGAIVAPAAILAPALGFLSKARGDSGNGAASLREGLATFGLAGRRVTVDTAALPASSLVTNEDEGAGAWTVRASQPEPGARYLVLTHTGEMLVTELVEGFGDRREGRRGGWMSTSAAGYPPGSRCAALVTVLGKVVAVQ